MHGSSFSGAAAPLLETLTSFYVGLLQRTAPGA
jgi:hypothetical protein